MCGKSRLRLSLRIVFYRESDSWIAHCLENDLAGDGETKQEAMESLVEAILLQFQASQEWNNPANFFRPADGRIFEMFALGKDVGQAVMEVSIEKLRHDDGQVEDVIGREYAEERSDRGDLIHA